MHSLALCHATNDSFPDLLPWKVHYALQFAKKNVLFIWDEICDLGLHKFKRSTEHGTSVHISGFHQGVSAWDWHFWARSWSYVGSEEQRGSIQTSGWCLLYSLNSWEDFRSHWAESISSVCLCKLSYLGLCFQEHQHQSTSIIDQAHVRAMSLLISPLATQAPQKPQRQLPWGQQWWWLHSRLRSNQLRTGRKSSVKEDST